MTMREYRAKTPAGELSDNDIANLRDTVESLSEAVEGYERAFQEIIVSSESHVDAIRIALRAKWPRAGAKS